MNPEFPKNPREELESRITALLLGELAEDEAAAVRRAIAQDHFLGQLHDRLKSTIDLVRESVTTANASAAAQAAPFKLSEERRQKLLAHFKTIRPREFARPRERERSWLVPVAAAAVIALLLGAMAVPNFIKARTSSMSNSIINNLRQLDGAKQQWALETHQTADAVPTLSDISPYLGRAGNLPPVSGEKYILGALNEAPKAELQRSGKVQEITLFDGAPPPTLGVRVATAKPAAQTTRESGAEEMGRVYPKLLATTPTPVTTLPPASAPTVAPPPRANIALPAAEPPEVQSTWSAGATLRGFYDDNLPARGGVGGIGGAGGGGMGGFGGGGFGGGIGGSGGGLGGAATAATATTPTEQFQTGSTRDDIAGLTHRYAYVTPPGEAESKTITGGTTVQPTHALPGDQLALTDAGGVATERVRQQALFADDAVNRNSFGANQATQPRAESANVGPARSGTLDFGAPPAFVAQGATPPVQQAAADALVRAGGGEVAVRGGAGGGGAGGGGRGGRGGRGRAAIAVPETPQVATQPVPPITLGISDSGAATATAGFDLANNTTSTRSRELAEARTANELGRASGGGRGEVIQNSGSFAITGARDKVATLGDVPLINNAFRAGFMTFTNAVAATDYADRPGRLNFGAGNANNPSYNFGAARTLDTWGTMDGTTSAPTVYDSGTQIGDLKLAINGQAGKGWELNLAGNLGRTTTADANGLRAVGAPIYPSNVVGYVNVPIGSLTNFGPLNLGETERSRMTVVLPPGTAGGRGQVDSDAGDAMQTKAIQLNWASATNMQSAVQQSLTDERSRVLANPRTGQIIIAGTEKDLNSAGDLLAKLDTPTRQTLIDGGLVESAPSSGARQFARAPIALPSTTAGAQGGMVTATTDPETRQFRAFLPAAETKGPSAASSDLDANGTKLTPSLESETLRHYNSLTTEHEQTYLAKQKQLNELKEVGKQSNEKLREVLPTMVNDPTLAELSGQLNLAQQNLAKLQERYPPTNPDVLRAKGIVGDLQNKAGARVDGIMAALENRVASEKTALDALKLQTEKARQEEIAKASQKVVEADRPASRVAPTNAPIPQPEVQTTDNAFSTFSLNVSDVSFKLAGASLEKGQMPDAASVRSEEFLNAFDYRDPEPPPGVPVGFAWDRARYPFAHNRDLLRFSVKTAAAGRVPGRPLNLVLLLDNSGSMERADRVQIIREALRVLATQLTAQDKLSVITFARTARLWVDGVPGSQAGAVFEQVSGLTPQGGTNLEEAMRLAYETALRHYLAGGINRVVVLTDGAANLGNVDPETLKQSVEAHRKQGIALDGFGIGWEGYNDDLLEVLTRNGDGRYGFLNTPEEAATDFAGQLAGALKVAASDVKVQVEFNPQRVTAYRQIGYAKHQLTKEQFRDNTVNAAQIGAAESGNALYVVEVNPNGTGPLCTVRVRYRVPGTADYHEHAWDVPFTGNAVALEQASPAMRLAATASAFSEWLVANPYAGEVTPDRLLGYLGGVPEVYGADARPKKLEWMIREAKSVAGK